MEAMISFVDAYRDDHGVEPICRVLAIAPSTYHEHARRRAKPETAPARVKADAALMKEIRRVQPEATIIVTWRGRGTSEDELGALARKAVSGQADDPEPMSLADMEKLLISAALRRTGGDITESAAILGIDRSTVYAKIKRYSIPR